MKNYGGDSENKGICYLVAAGESVPLDFVPNDSDLVIAVDGGLKYLQRAKITPNIILGDFDSLGYIPDEPSTLRLDPVKDETDAFAAAAEGLKRGYRNFVIYCALGGRLSHTLANIHTLSYLHNNGAEAKIIGEGTELFIIGQSAQVAAGGYMSLIPIGGAAEVMIENCKYSGTFKLTTLDSLGVSNEPLEGAKVTVISGEALVIIERK